MDAGLELSTFLPPLAEVKQFAIFIASSQLILDPDTVDGAR